MSYPLLGPIGPNGGVILTSQRGSTMYVLNTYTDTSGNTQLILDSNVKLIIDSAEQSVPIFSVHGTNQDLKLIWENGAGALSFNDKFKAGIATLPLSIDWNQNIYATWNQPALLLSGIQYILNDPQTGTTLNFDYGTIDDAGNGHVSGNVEAQLIPNPYPTYFSCNNGAVCEMDDSTNIIRMPYCSRNKGDTGRCGPDQILRGWSTIQDATDGISYTYCTEKLFCSPDCKGPCSNNLDDCSYDATNAQFLCEFDVNNLFIGSWWKSAWFIIFVVVLFVLFVILLFVKYYY